ncbi:MAG: family 1 glycosylhydrolase [bacterium]|nr:family 1 glycosylhydrolase [bacterium]
MDSKIPKGKKKFDTYSFPKDFLWGTATAGHQIEGGNFDQWTVWELDNAADMAKDAANRLRWLPSWLDIKNQAEDPENYVSGKGVDHIRRYKEDFRILKKLNLNAFSFSIEWSRVEPDQGVWDKKAIDRYHNYLNEMKTAGIEPVIKLWHWTHPVWFDELGGFGKRKNVVYFERYVEKIAQEFGDDIRYVITLNEPNVYPFYSDFNEGVKVPPYQSKWRRAMTFFWLVRAHKRAYEILKKRNHNLWVSAAVQFAHNAPKKLNWLSRLAVWGADYFGNYLFYNLTRNQLDYIAINHYFTNYFDGLKQHNPPQPVSDLGWYMEPANIGEVCVKVWLRYRKPIMITENGVADSEDKYRQWWLEETMRALVSARQAGADIFGYLHWSLLDNFEWHQGWWPKFGLIKVDRNRDMKRLVRPSAVWWARTLAKIKHE